MKQTNTEKNTSYKIDPNPILTQEFDFAKNLLLHSCKELRHIVHSFIIFIAVLFSAIGLFLHFSQENYLVDQTTWRCLIFSLLFLSCIIGLINLLKIIRLRIDWWDCLSTMNNIKDYYNEIIPECHIKDRAFQWSTERFFHFRLQKSDSLFFYSALTVILVGAIVLSAALLFANLNILITFILAFVFIILQIIYYKVRLSRIKTISSTK